MEHRSENSLPIWARTFSVKCAKYPLKWLPLLMHLSCLEASASVSEYSRETFRQLARYTPQVISSSDMASPWDEVTYSNLDPLLELLNGRLDMYGKNVFQRNNANIQTKYPLLTKLMKALLCFTHGNADVRGFSQNNNVLPIRSSLSLQGINGIRHTLALAQRYNSASCKFAIDTHALRAVRNALKHHSQCTAI